MKIALYFGSFDPIHIYHETIINHLLEHEGMDNVNLIPSPQSPHKGKITDFEDRFNMCVQYAVNFAPRCYVNPIEKFMEIPSYTIDTLKEIKKTADKSHKFYLIMGFDNWLKIKTWKNWKTVLKEYPILVIPRNGSNEQDFKSYKEFMESEGIEIHTETRLVKGIPDNQVSSTFIRNEIKQGFNVYPYLNKDVYNYIKSKKLYK